MTGTTFNIPDIGGNPQPVTTIPTGCNAAANSKSVAQCTEDKTQTDAIVTNTAATGTALSDVTDTDGSLQVAFYYNGVKIDPTAAGAIIGATAAGSALSFAPVTTGGLAKTGNPTAVSDAQVVNARFSKLGDLVSIPALREVKAIQTTTITGTSETTIVTAGGAGVFKDLYRLVITNTSATATSVTIKDATAGTTRYVFALPAASTVGFSAGGDQIGIVLVWAQRGERRIALARRTGVDGVERLQKATALALIKEHDILLDEPERIPRLRIDIDADNLKAGAMIPHRSAARPAEQVQHPPPRAHKAGLWWNAGRTDCTGSIRETVRNDPNVPARFCKNAG